MRFLALLLLLAGPARADWVFDVGDEEVLVMPTFARPAADGTWRIPVRGFVYEREPRSLKRRAVARTVAKAIGVDDDSPAYALLRERMTWLLVDHESNKTVRLAVGGAESVLGPTGYDGVFAGEVVAPPGTGAVTLAFAGRDRAGSVAVPRVAAEGWSVISDVDDTIKVTEVLDRRRMLENTFANEFKAVAGMPARYAGWARAGAFVHYVSASPEQLLPPLYRFAAVAGLPAGSWHLRNVHWSVNDLDAMVKAPDAFKLGVIVGLLESQPRRRFVLVGDSGERDPEVYGEIARRFPAQVRRVFIRLVPGANNAGERFGAAFRDLPAERWRTFADPAELPDAPDAEAPAVAEKP